MGLRVVTYTRRHQTRPRTDEETRVPHVWVVWGKRSISETDRQTDRWRDGGERGRGWRRGVWFGEPLGVTQYYIFVNVYYNGDGQYWNTIGMACISHDSQVTRVSGDPYGDPLVRISRLKGAVGPIPGERDHLTSPGRVPFTSVGRTEGRTPCLP